MRITVVNSSARFPEVSLKEKGWWAGIGESMSVWCKTTSVKADSMVMRTVDGGMGTPREMMLRARLVLAMLNIMGRVGVLGDEKLACCC